MKQCSIKGCGKIHYSKGYCRKHYANFLRCGDPLGVTHKKTYCEISGCRRYQVENSKYCKKHNNNFLRYGKPSLKKGEQMIGSLNHNWCGGTFEYKNHYEMKKQRILKLKAVNGKCEICGAEAQYIHHLDGSKDNHSIANLAALCSKCHGFTHRGRKAATSKYIRIYGMTLKELSLKLGACQATIYHMHNKGTLKNVIAQNMEDFINEN